MKNAGSGRSDTIMVLRVDPSRTTFVVSHERIDESTLQAVAEITGGQYYKAESADQLQEALGDLPSQVTVVRKHVDIASWFAGAGGLLVAVAVGLSLWWNRVRAPR